MCVFYVFVCLFTCTVYVFVCVYLKQVHSRETLELAGPLGLVYLCVLCACVYMHVY